MRNPDNLHVLTRADALVLSLHRSPLRFHGRRAPGLHAQLLRAAGSIAFNIAEGAALEDRGFVRHLTIAIASSNEAERQLRLANGLDLLGPDGDWQRREIIEVRKMMLGLKKSVLRRLDP